MNICRRNKWMNEQILSPLPSWKSFRQKWNTQHSSWRRRQCTPLQSSCLENPMDGGAWWAAVHGVAKSRTRLSDFTFTFHFHVLEKAMATHSSVLAWRIPGTGEPGGLPSMGSHRVRHDWSDLAAVAAVGFPGGSDGKESACNAGDPSSIPGSGKSPGWREWQPIPVLLLWESMDRGAWQATVHGVQRVRHDWAFKYAYTS